MPAALLTAVDSTDHIHLVIGWNSLAAARCTKSLDVGAKTKVIAPADADLHYGLQNRIEHGQVEWLQRSFCDSDLTQLGRSEIDGVVDAVFVTIGVRDDLSVHVSKLCRRLRIPVNISDAPSLCTFTLLSTYSDGPLHIGVTTSGKGCKLASRIRREVASSLPPNLGAACDRLGSLRRRIREEDQVAEVAFDLEDEEDDSGQKSSFNQLVTTEDRNAARGRRMRWLSQMCEYWPLARLASISEDDVARILADYTRSLLDRIEPASSKGMEPDYHRHTRSGRIILAGSGPGSPDLLTTATHKAILSADLILADKLVPAPVLSLVPRRTTVYIARKFPGNADRAQEELLEMGLAGLRAGQTVVRLKQGDPYVYGRGAEEYDFFKRHGYRATVLPGITSALSAPLFAMIPPTHRAVSDQVLICTGTGRQGAAPEPPWYNPSQTVVILMALHRLPALISSLTEVSTETADLARTRWPKQTPCAVIERASCPDQRVIRSTLQYVEAAVEEEGSRPPGLLVVGSGCTVLWQGEQRWVVEEGFNGLDGIGGDDFTGISHMSQDSMDKAPSS